MPAGIQPPIYRHRRHTGAYYSICTRVSRSVFDACVQARLCATYCFEKYVTADANRLQQTNVFYTSSQVGIAKEKVVNIDKLSELAAAELFVASAPRHRHVRTCVEWLRSAGIRLCEVGCAPSGSSRTWPANMSLEPVLIRRFPILLLD